MRKYLGLFFIFFCGAVHAQGYLADVEHGATSVVLPCIPLRALDDSPAGGTLETAITNSTAGLEIKVRADVTNGWLDEYSQASGTINAITGNIGSFETPDANDAHFEEIASGAGCYQLILDNTTWNQTNAKYVEILIRDSSSPTFADTLVRVNLNAVSAATLADTIWDEACAGHTTSDTTGDQVCDEAGALATSLTSVSNAIDDMTDGTTPVWGLGDAVQSVADSGTTTSITDTALDQADTDYWGVGNEVVFLSGNLNGQTRCVTGFTPGTDTLAFYPAVTNAVSTHTYAIRANAGCSVLEKLVEDQDGGYSASEVLSVLLSEAAGTCTYTSGTRTWACSDPGGSETRLTIVYGSSLDGTRTSSTPAPATP